MEIDKKAVKEWKAEYKLINEMEHEELKERLAHETVEESVRSFFFLEQADPRFLRYTG